MMTGNGFEFMGMPAMLGRYFVPSDAPDNHDPQPVTVLSYKFWQRHYRGDPSVVGKTIQLSHKTYTILGVLPPRFTWGGGDLYLPLKMASDQTHRYEAKIKLKTGISLAAAEAEFRPCTKSSTAKPRTSSPSNSRSAYVAWRKPTHTIWRRRCSCSSGRSRCC